MASREQVASTDGSGQAVIEATGKVKASLQALRGQVRTHNGWSSGSKIAGGLAGIGGGLCLAVAPFTAGTSLLIAGSIAAGAGTVTTLGVNIGEAIQSPKFDAELKRLDADLHQALQDFITELANLMVSHDGGGNADLKKVTVSSLKIISTATGLGSKIFGTTKTVTPLVMEIGVGTVDIAPGAAAAVTGAAGGAAKSASTVTQTGASVTRTSTSAAGTVLAATGGVITVVLGGLDVYQGVQDLTNGHAVDRGIEKLLAKVQDVEDRVRQELENVHSIFG